MPLSTHAGGNPAMDLASHPGGSRNTPSRFTLQKTRDKHQPDGQLGSYADFTFYLPICEQFQNKHFCFYFVKTSLMMSLTATFVLEGVTHSSSILLSKQKYITNRLTSIVKYMYQKIK